MGTGDSTPLRQFAAHPRVWRTFSYVYPVISRRSEGLSIGVNLNPDASCNFDCIYCCVNRAQPRGKQVVDLHRLSEELDQLVGLSVDGSLWREPEFDDVGPGYRRINDIAFSGDGEPTASPVFEQACRLASGCRERHGLADVKLVVITNATLLDRPAVQRGIGLLGDAGDLWAKLDAGSEGYYQVINHSSAPLERVLANIRDAGQSRVLTLQTLMLRFHGQAMSEEEFGRYLGRLRWLRETGCQIGAVQLYTVARVTSQPGVGPVEAELLERRAAAVRDVLPGASVKTYPSPADG